MCMVVLRGLWCSGGLWVGVLLFVAEVVVLGCDGGFPGYLLLVWVGVI